MPVMKKYMFAALTLLLFSHLQVYASHIITHSKTHEQHVHVGSHDRLVINNLYGNITIHTWHRDEACITTTILGRGITEAEALAAMNRSSVKASIHEGGAAMLSFTTEITEGGVTDVAEQTEDDPGIEVMTNYEVYIPEDMSLDLSVFGGNVCFKDDFTGALHLAIESGRLVAQQLYGAAKYISIDAPRGLKSSITYLDNGYLNGTQGLTLNRAGHITVNTSRGLSIEDAGTIHISGHNNNLSIGSVRELYGSLERMTTSINIYNIVHTAHLFITDCSRVSFHTFGSNIGRVDIHARNSLLHFAHPHDMAVQITARDKTKVTNCPWYLHSLKNGGEYTGKTGNGAGLLLINAIGSTVTF